MFNRFNFREPLNVELDGTYITVGQMQFYLNRKNAPTRAVLRDPTFLAYYNKMRVYNKVSDIMETDPLSAIMYWNPDTEGVAIAYPEVGVVADALLDILHIQDITENVDGEDSWGAGL